MYLVAAAVALHLLHTADGSNACIDRIRMRSLFLGVVAGTEQPLERGKRRVTIASAPETALSGKQIHSFIAAVDSA